MANEYSRKSEDKGDDLQVRQNMAATFLIENGIAGSETDDTSRKTADALRHLTQFEEINPKLTANYVDFVNSSQRTVEIYGEKGVRFFQGIDQVLNEFVANSGIIFEVEKAGLEAEFRRNKIGEPELLSELIPRMFRNLLSMINESDVKDIFEEEGDFTRSVGALKLMPFVTTLTDNLIHTNENRDS